MLPGGGGSSAQLFFTGSVTAALDGGDVPLAGAASATEHGFCSPFFGCQQRQTVIAAVHSGFHLYIDGLQQSSAEWQEYRGSPREKRKYLLLRSAHIAA
ncbi:unnamed protein product [Victoria cruziana]